MPIYSYLVYPRQGKKDLLVNNLSNFSECEVVESTNEDVIVLVTDTPDEIREGYLQENLKLIPEILGMALVYGQEV